MCLDVELGCCTCMALCIFFFIWVVHWGSTV
jgi:hypothetical protein